MAKSKRLEYETFSRRVQNYDVLASAQAIIAGNDAIVRANELLNNTPDITGFEYEDQNTNLTNTLENYIELAKYPSELYNELYELDQAFMKALANGPVEALSNIHMEDITVDNTLGLTETTVQTINGQPVEITSKKVSLSFNDFIGYTDKGSVIDSEYVEGFEDIFKDQYEQLNIKDCDFDEYIEMLSTLGEFSHSMYQPTKEFISGSLDILTFGVKPLIDAIAGGDIITGEKLTDTERVWKVVEGIVSIVTLGGIVSKLGSLGVKVTAKILIIEIAPDFVVLGNGMFLESMGVDGKKAGYLSLALGLALGIGGGKWQDEIAGVAQQGKHADDILEKVDVDDVTDVRRVESGNPSIYSGKEWDEYLKEKYGVDKVSWETKPGALKGGNGSIKNNLIDRIKSIRTELPNTKLSKRGNMAAAEVDIKGIKDEFIAHSQINNLSDKGTDIADFSYLKPESERIFTSYVDDKFPRYHDTEAKILEDIASQIKDNNISGTINLYSELPCCQSCSNIILEFRRMYPNIKLNVYVE